MISIVLGFEYHILIDQLNRRNAGVRPSYFFVVIGGKKKGDAVGRVIVLRGKNRQIFTRVKG